MIPRGFARCVCRVAVNKGTGEIKILRSVQAADAGRVANPMQCRGQVEGGVAQSLGATLYEEMVIDDDGRVVNPNSATIICLRSPTFRARKCFLRILAIHWDHWAPSP